MSCSECGKAGKYISTHCYDCGNHHSSSKDCPKPKRGGGRCGRKVSSGGISCSVCGESGRNATTHCHKCDKHHSSSEYCKGKAKAKGGGGISRAAVSYCYDDDDDDDDDDEEEEEDVRIEEMLQQLRLNEEREQQRKLDDLRREQQREQEKALEYQRQQLALEQQKIAFERERMAQSQKYERELESERQRQRQRQGELDRARMAQSQAVSSSFMQEKQQFELEKQKQQRWFEEQKRELEEMKKRTIQSSIARANPVSSASTKVASPASSKPWEDRAIFSIDLKELKYSVTDASSKLGHGTFGIVYRGKYYNMPVAVKVLSQPDPNFQQEARAMHNIKHPNIIRFFGALTEPMSVLVMELMASNLETFLGQIESDMDHYVFFKIAKGIIAGMRYLHEMRIVHFDLKPQNILLDAVNNVKIADFGLSKTMQSMLMHSTQAMRGTPIYAAPECLGKKRAPFRGPPSDVYSFGIILWQMLTREKPWSQLTSIEEVIETVLFEKERPELPRDCPPSLRALITSCWCDDTAIRPTFTKIESEVNQLSCPDEWRKVFQEAGVTRNEMDDPEVTDVLYRAAYYVEKKGVKLEEIQEALKNLKPAERRELPKPSALPKPNQNVDLHAALMHSLKRVIQTRRVAMNHSQESQ